MMKKRLLNFSGMPYPLPPDPLSPIPDQVEHELATYRAGDVQQARTALAAIAESGRTSVTGHAAMALAGIELTENGLNADCKKWLEQVAAGEDPWLGPLAAVMLDPDVEKHITGPYPLLDHLASQLTGDLAAARQGFEQVLIDSEEWQPDLDRDGMNLVAASMIQPYICKILLGNALIQSGESAAALEPLTSALEKFWDIGILAAYARFLKGHVLIELDKRHLASPALFDAADLAHPRMSRTDRMLPWALIRYGELLAGNPDLAADIDDVQNADDIYLRHHVGLVRTPFRFASQFTEVSRPAMADIGYHLFPTADFESVYAAMERLKTWSDERYERARRLILLLHYLVSDQRNEEKTRKLTELREKLDLPCPRFLP